MKNWILIIAILALQVFVVNWATGWSQSTGGPCGGLFTNITQGPGCLQMEGATCSNGQPSSITGVNINGIANATVYPGLDIGAKVNNAIAGLGAQGGTVYIPAGIYSYNTTIQCPQGGDLPIIIQGAGQSSDYNYAGTVLQYTGTGDAVNDMADNAHQNIKGCELRDFTLDGGVNFPNNTGFHFGGTIYTRTQNMMIREFGNCVMAENTACPNCPGGPGNGHWTERYDLSKTNFSECNKSVLFYENGGTGSFMHGKMDIHVGMFNTQNGVVIDHNPLDNVATNVTSGVDFEINGNMAPDSTMPLITITNGSYLQGKMTLLPECMNSTPCTRFAIDATSSFSGQIFGGMPGSWHDNIFPGASFNAVYTDSRVFAQTTATCQGIMGLNPNQTAELFTVQNWGSFASGPLSISSRYSGNASARIYALAAASCSNNVSTTLTHETLYANGAPFTVSENCMPTANIGNGTATHPQYPAGSTQYNITNNAPQPVTVDWSFLNTVIDTSSRVISPVSGTCM